MRTANGFNSMLLQKRPFSSFRKALSLKTPVHLCWMKLKRGKKTIPIKRNQKILPPRPVRWRTTPSLSSCRPLIAKAYANYVPDTVENRESIRKVMDAGGYSPDWYELCSEPMIQTKELNLQAVHRPAVIMAYLLVSFAFLSYQNAAVYFLDKNKWLNLAYLHGTPFLRRYRFLWLRVLIPYVTALLAVTLFPDFFRQIMNLSYEDTLLISWKLSWRLTPRWRFLQDCLGLMCSSTYSSHGAFKNAWQRC